MQMPTAALGGDAQQMLLDTVDRQAQSIRKR